MKRSKKARYHIHRHVYCIYLRCLIVCLLTRLLLRTVRDVKSRIVIRDGLKV
jgi:hypothetical protein